MATSLSLVKWRRPRKKSEGFLYGESDDAVVRDLHLELGNAMSTASRGRLQAWLWRLLAGVMGFFFFFAAVVQLNDPDPFLWVPVYGVPCFMSWWVMTRSNSRSAVGPAEEAVILLHLTYSTTLGLWTLTLSIPLLLAASDPPPDPHAWWREEGVMFAEEGKELLGLCLSTAWMMMIRNQEVRKWQVLAGFVLTLLPILSWIHLESIEEQIKNC